MSWIQIALHVKKCLSKYGDDYFTRFKLKHHYTKIFNVNIHHQWASLFTLNMDSQSQIINFNDASYDNSNFNSE